MSRKKPRTSAVLQLATVSKLDFPSLYLNSQLWTFCWSLIFGVVEKLRLQEEGGRWSKNVDFLSTFIRAENINGGPGGRWSKKAKILST